MTNQSTYFKANPFYTPAMMKYNGSTGYYNILTPTTSGNKFTVVIRFQSPEFTGGTIKQIMTLINSSGYVRCGLQIGASDHANTTRRNKLHFYTQDTTGTLRSRFQSISEITDGDEHTALIAYDGDAGTAVMYIDGVAEIDTGSADYTAPAVGAIASSASSDLYIGSNQVPANYHAGELGFFGYADAYLTNWQDFMQFNGDPKQLEEFGWTQWGGTFSPPVQDYNGSTSHQVGSNRTTAGNKVTGIISFKGSAGTGGGSQYLMRINGASSYIRCSMLVGDSDHSDTEFRNKLRFRVVNSSNVTICDMISTMTVTDNVLHTALCAFDGDAGTAVMIIDGLPDEDTGWTNRVAPTTGTLPSGGGYEHILGAASVTPTNLFTGQIGFAGYIDGYITNANPFIENGLPQEIDEDSWVAFGGVRPAWWNKYGNWADNKGTEANATATAITHIPNSQPLFWNEHGEMDNNVGSAGNMTRNGTIIVGKGGN
jgi:hypothetical protein